VRVLEADLGRRNPRDRQAWVLRARATAIYGILPAIGYAIGAGMYFWGRTFGIWGIVFATGGIFNAIYTLGLALLGQRFQAKALVSAGAAFMTTYSIGAVGGPPLVGALMDAFGARSLPLVLGDASQLGPIRPR
jgi:hypothetical protein